MGLSLVFSISVLDPKQVQFAVQIFKSYYCISLPPNQCKNNFILGRKAYDGDGDLFLKKLN